MVKGMKFGTRNRFYYISNRERFEMVKNAFKGQFSNKDIQELFNVECQQVCYALTWMRRKNLISKIKVHDVRCYLYEVVQ